MAENTNMVAERGFVLQFYTFVINIRQLFAAKNLLSWSVKKIKTSFYFVASRL